MPQVKKPKYHLYPLQGKKMIREVRKQDKSLRKMSDEDLSRMLHEHLAKNDESSDGFNVHCDEYFWERSGKQHIIIPDTETIDGLLRGKYDIDAVDYQLMPFESFTMVLPADFRVAGLSPSGVMVTSLAAEDVMDRLLTPFTRHLHMDNVDYRVEHPKDTFAISLNYTIQGTPWVSRQCINSNMIGQLLACKTSDEYQAAIGHLPGAEIDVNSQLDHQDRELAFVLTKLAFALAVYLRCKPEVLKEGFPKTGIKAVQGDMHLAKHDNTHVFNMEKAYRSAPSAHHRAWFIRTLRHEKYYKGTFADWPRGSRTTFVDEATISSGSGVTHIA